MTRPRKQTVDWFPHAINHGRTIFTLEQRYGNDGYAFWFKLLELLGNTEGHFLNFRDTPTAQYLQAYTDTDEPVCIEILNLLAGLEAIDRDLWGQKIIWSQGFVDGLAELYARRKIALPTKASILEKTNPNRELEGFIEIQENCRKITRQAVESGTLIKGPCEICERTDKIEAHHTDYTKPFDVRWLCKSDHAAWHNCEQNALSAGLMLAETSLTRFIEVRKLARERVERVKEGERVEKDIAPPGPSDAVGAVLFFSCPYFDVNLDYRFKLAKEYPALHDDLLRKELSKMEDWISDNAQKKKFKANGHLANPKLFIKNWLDKIDGILGPGRDEPKGYAAIRKFVQKGEADSG